MQIKYQNGDYMTPKERMRAMLSGEKFDRYPCAPVISELKPVLTGTSVREFWYDPIKMAEAEIQVFQRFQYDKITIGPNTRGITEALGGEFIYPQSGCPFIRKPFLTDYKQLDYLTPVNALTSPRMAPFSIEAEILNEKLGNIIDLTTHIGGPFTIASNLLGIERLLRDCRRFPEHVLKLLRIICDSQKSCIDWAAQYNLGICMADPVASVDLIGPKMYQEFVYPLTKELTDYAHLKTGQKVYLHMCGNSRKIWDFFKEYSLSALSLDNCIDLRDAVDFFGNDVIVTSNIDPIEIMMSGSKEKIFNSIKNCIEIGKDCKKGFVLSTGCDVPSSTPAAHTDWFMEAARKYSHTS